MKKIKFPKRLKYISENPVYNFYERCMKSGYNRKLIPNKPINVSAFFVNPKDYTKLRKLLEKFAKSQYDYLNLKRIKLAVSYELLDIGPVEDKNVKEGTVMINTERLYDRT